MKIRVSRVAVPDEEPLAPGERWLSSPQVITRLGLRGPTALTMLRLKPDTDLPGYPFPGDRRKLRFKLSDVKRVAAARKQKAKKAARQS